MRVKEKIIMNMIKSFYFNRIKLCVAFKKVIAFILIAFLLICQIMPFTVYASAVPVGQPVTVEGLGWKIIEGSGPEPDLVRDPFLLGVEGMTTFGLGTLAAQSFWEETNAEIAQKIQDGTLSNMDVGEVVYKEVDGQQVPVAIKNTIYGQNMYFITDDLAHQIQQQNLQLDADISALCLDYWERVIISDIEPFQQAAEAAENWVTSFPDLTVQAQTLISQIMFDLFGVGEEIDPESTFLTDGCWIKYKTRPTATSYTERKVNVSSLSNYKTGSFIVLTWASTYSNKPVHVYALYAHLNSESDPMIYNRIDALWGYDESDYGTVVNGLPVKETTPEALGTTGTTNAPTTYDFTNVFESWPEIVALPDAQPMILPNVHYNVGNITGAVNDICAAADAALAAQTSPGGSPEFTPETRPEISPSEMPELLPEPYEVPWPVTFPQEFPDPDPWIVPDSNPWPSPVPDPGVDPDPNPDPNPNPDPEPEPDDNPFEDTFDPADPDHPQLRLPVLTGLFPFCIPFDLYDTFVILSAREQNPVWDIPLQLTVRYNGSVHTFVNTSIHLDLTQYGLDSFFAVLRGVQIIVFIVTLGIFTKQFIY